MDPLSTLPTSPKPAGADEREFTQLALPSTSWKHLGFKLAWALGLVLTYTISRGFLDTMLDKIQALHERKSVREWVIIPVTVSMIYVFASDALLRHSKGK